MKLTNIKISGYKSIDEIEFPIEKRNGSYATILLGKNETGKSNILDALALPNYLGGEENIDFLSVRNQNNEPEIVSVFYTMVSESQKGYRDFIASKIKISDKLLQKIEVVKATKEIYIQQNDTEYDYEWQFELKEIILDSVAWGELNETKIINGVSRNVDVVNLFYNGEIKDEDKELFETITIEKFREILDPILGEYFEKFCIDVSVWKSDPNYLIQDEIDLKEFADKSYKYPPLRNMFALAGFVTNDDIKGKITEIEKHSNYRRKLADTLSKSTTKYINDKWPEHKVLIDVTISDELNIHVKVQDKDNTNTFYNMDERSQGFKQFISLLLSISAKNKSKTIQNNLILIDEPEVHLHPSGIRYMLKELLEIGKNNYLFIATHSNFMLDKTTKDRHFKISKDKGLTTAKQISTDADLNDDELLQSAFGINVVRDLLPEHKILVEGKSDKVLFYKLLNQLKADHGIAITNGNGSNVPTIASLLAYSEVFPLVLVDDDDEGTKIKGQVTKIDSEFSDKVFTIRDCFGSIISGGSLEDTLPIDYVRLKINSELKAKKISDITFTEDSPFIDQLKNHLQKETSSEPDKQSTKMMIDTLIKEIKIRISDDYDEKTIKIKAPKLWALGEDILKKLKISA